MTNPYGQDNYNPYRGFGKGLNQGEVKIIGEFLTNEKVELNRIMELVGRMLRRDKQEAVWNLINWMLATGDAGDFDYIAVRMLLIEILIGGMGERIDAANNAVIALSFVGGLDSDDSNYKRMMEQELGPAPIPGEYQP